MELTQPTVLKATDVTFVKCDCCGLSEECTEEYIKRVRERYSGRWICGLCSEAVKDEVVRSADRIGNEEALNQHMSFCKKFKNLSPPKNPTEDLICAVKQLLFKSLDSPRSSPVKKPGLVRSVDWSSPVKSPASVRSDQNWSSPVKSSGLVRSENWSSPVKKTGLTRSERWSSPVKKSGPVRSENCFSGRLLDKFNEN